MHGRSPLQGGNSAFITLLRARPSLHTLLRDGSQSRDAAQSGQCEGGWFQHVLIAATHTVFYSYLGFCVLDMDGLARVLSLPLFFNILYWSPKDIFIFLLASSTGRSNYRVCFTSAPQEVNAFNIFLKDLLFVQKNKMHRPETKDNQTF